MSNKIQYNNDYTSVNVESGSDDSPQSNDRYHQQNDPKIQKLKEHVSEVSNIMQQNIDKILERGSRLDHLEDRSEMLSTRADEFRVSSRRVARKMWWNNMKVNIIIGVVIIIIILIIIFSVTGGEKH